MDPYLTEAQRAMIADALENMARMIAYAEYPRSTWLPYANLCDQFRDFSIGPSDQTRIKKDAPTPEADGLEILRRLAERSMTLNRADPSWGLIPAGVILGITDPIYETQSSTK